MRMGIEGLLRHFKERHISVSRTNRGESRSAANASTVESIKHQLRLLKEYEAKTTFTVEETGFFYIM